MKNFESQTMLDMSGSVANNGKEMMNKHSSIQEKVELLQLIGGGNKTTQYFKPGDICKSQAKSLVINCNF